MMFLVCEYHSKMYITYKLVDVCHWGMCPTSFTNRVDDH